MILISDMGWIYLVRAIGTYRIRPSRSQLAVISLNYRLKHLNLTNVSIEKTVHSVFIVFFSPYISYSFYISSLHYARFFSVIFYWWCVWFNMLFWEFLVDALTIKFAVYFGFEQNEFWTFYYLTNRIQPVTFAPIHK